MIGPSLHTQPSREKKVHTLFWASNAIPIEATLNEGEYHTVWQNQMKHKRGKEDRRF